MVIGEFAIELTDVSSLQKSISLLDILDPSDPQLLRQTSLPRSETTLAAASWPVVSTPG